jgi:DNA repair protein RecO (recombination protein O)
MLVKTEGIVIKKVRFSETSVITQIYTSNYGMLGFHIPGVYSKKGQIKPSYFQPLQILELDFYLKGNQNLKKAKEIKPAHIYDSLHTDFQKSSLGLLISELLFKTIKEEEENPELYNFLKTSFLILDKQTNKLGNFIISFLVNFSKYLGFFPNNNFDDSHPYFHLMEGRFAETNYDQRLFNEHF